MLINFKKSKKYRKIKRIYKIYFTSVCKVYFTFISINSYSITKVVTVVMAERKKAVKQ